MHQVACLLLCLGLSGIAVGLGARLPNFREQSPARIAAGFGGTLTLVLSALYIVAIVLLVAMPCHYYLYLTTIAGQPEQAAIVSWLLLWTRLGAAGGALLTAVAIAWPIWLGLRAFRRMEF
jgi:ABC-2 type transport system permease protein